MSLNRALGAGPSLALRACSSSNRPLTCADAIELCGSCCNDEGEGRDPLLERLALAFSSDLLGATLPAVAARLGMSSRSLQRRLREQGTSFRLELEAARIEEAKRRMLSSNVTLTTIALDVGFASVQGFGRCFQRSTGLCPRAWRAATAALVKAENDQPDGGCGNAERGS